jgi:transcriptional regulator with XRE-family HTH domain
VDPRYPKTMPAFANVADAAYICRMEVSRHWQLALNVLAGLRDLSPKQLAERSGVHPNSVRMYLRKPRNLELETLEKLLRGLDIEILDLALVMTLLKKIDKERSLPLFEVAEPEVPIEGSDASPEFLRLFAQVQWLYEEMQRQLRGRSYPAPRPPRFPDLTDR